MDRETGRARGFAFVEMPNDEEAAKAIAALDGKELGGRNLKVNEARPKAAGGGPRPGGGGGGRGRGGFSNEDYREATRQPGEPRCERHAYRAPIGSFSFISRRFDDDYVSKAPEGNEAVGQATRKTGKTRTKKARKARRERCSKR